MNELLLSFLDKLPNESSISQVAGDKSSYTLSKLSKRDLAISDDKIRGLAILLQSIDTEIFTNEELIEVSKLPLHYLDNNTLVNKPANYLSSSNPTYDTGSLRVYRLIDVLSIDNYLYGNSSAIRVLNENIRELIILLAERGEIV